MLKLSIILMTLTLGLSAFAQDDFDLTKIYPLVEEVSLDPSYSVGSIGSGTGELIRKDLVITAAHVAVHLKPGEDSFAPFSSVGKNGLTSPYGSYKVKEVIYSKAIQDNPELMESMRTGEKYWEKEGKADFAFVRIEPVDLKKYRDISLLKLSKESPCDVERTYYITGYPSMWPMGKQRTNFQSFPKLECSEDKALLFINGYGVTGFSGGLVSESNMDDAKIAGILVAGGRLPRKPLCTSAELATLGSKNCGLWVIPSNIILKEFKTIP